MAYAPQAGPDALRRRRSGNSRGSPTLDRGSRQDLPKCSAQGAATLRTADDLPVHSFQTLLADLATLAKNRIQPKLPDSLPFEMITRPTVLQQKALSLLGVTL